MGPLYAVYIALLAAGADSDADPATVTAFARHACPTGPFGPVGALLFLLGEGAPATGVATFLSETGPRLAAELRRRPQPMRADPREIVAGRIDWAATTKGRASGDPAAASRYVCRVNRPDYDQLENQLFCYLLRAVEQSLAHVSSAGLIEVGSVGAARDGASLRDAADCLHRIRRALPPTGAITMPSRIDEGHLRAADTTRSPEYARLVPLYAHYRDLVESPCRGYWRHCLRTALPLPSSIRALLPPGAWG